MADGGCLLPAWVTESKRERRRGGIDDVYGVERRKKDDGRA